MQLLILFMINRKKCPVPKQLNLWDILMFSKKNTMIQLLTFKKELSSKKKKSRKRLLRSTLLFMTLTGYAPGMICGKISAILHWARSITNLVSIPFWPIDSAIRKNSTMPTPSWRCWSIPGSFFLHRKDLLMMAENVFLKKQITPWMILTAVFLFWISTKKICRSG